MHGTGGGARIFAWKYDEQKIFIYKLVKSIHEFDSIS